MKSLLALMLFLNLCADAGYGADRILDTHPLPATTQSEAEILKQFGFEAPQVGYQVFNLNGETKTSRNAQTGFITASVAKISTTLAALAILGPEFRFHTNLSYHGHFSAGVLDGDLYLKGGGDPLLTMAEVMDLVESLSQHHIHEVVGNFYYDDFDYPTTSMISEGFEPDAAYNPGVSALSFEFNRQSIVTTPNTNQIEAFLEPPYSKSHLELAPPEKTNEHVGYRRQDGQDYWALPSTLSPVIAIPVKDPSAFTAEVFVTLCRNSGIKISAPKHQRQPPGVKMLRRLRSQPLLELVERNLEFSNNLMSELIMLATAKNLRGSLTDLAAAAHSITAWWKNQLPKVNWEHYVYVSGSGGWSHMQATPEQLVAFLRWADQNRFGERSYLSLLPISGWKGTLADRLYLPDQALRVWAKTGTIDFGSALAGYFFSKSGKRYAFSLLVNDRPRRAEVEANRLKGESETQRAEEEKLATDWKKRARSLQDALLTRWINESWN